MVAIGGTILVARALIERRRGKRSEAFIEQLPEIARMLANGASAGLSIPQALAMASRELAEPGGAELQAASSTSCGSGSRSRTRSPACAPGCRRARSRSC